MKLFLFINVEMPTIVAISIFMGKKNRILGLSENHENMFETGVVRPNECYSLCQVRRHNGDIFSIFFEMKESCVFILESPHRGDSNKYTQYQYMKKEDHPKLSQICSYVIFSKVRKNRGKRAISVRASEVLLYVRKEQTQINLCNRAIKPKFFLKAFSSVYIGIFSFTKWVMSVFIWPPAIWPPICMLPVSSVLGPVVQN